VAFIAGSIWGRHHTEKKYLFEAGLISESDKVETYVRSFLRATDLSSLQAIHDSGNEQIVLPYDFSSSGYPQYSDNYKMAYWQIFDEENNKMPLPEIMLNRIRQEVSWISTCYLNDYLKSFGDFSQVSGFEMTIPDPDLSPVIAKATFDGQTIRVEGEETSFQRTAEVDEQEINIVRRFNPYSNVETRLGEIIQLVWNIISNDQLGGCIKGTSDQTDAETRLTNLVDSLKADNPGIEFIFEILDFQAPDSERRAIINVSIYDSSQDYAFYSFPNYNVGIDYLGVNFLAKVGDSGVIGDKVSASSLTDFDDCSGYSGLGIISPKDTDDICKFFKVAPTTCSDTDGVVFTTKGTCEDFTGFYEDTCDDNTLYEYYCFDGYQICHYEKHDCLPGEECQNGACITCEDFDGDGYDTCDPPAGDGNPADCDDSDPLRNPGATEDCDDTLDNDCDGLVDCDDTDCDSDPACPACTGTNQEFCIAFIFQECFDVGPECCTWNDAAPQGEKCQKRSCSGMPQATCERCSGCTWTAPADCDDQDLDGYDTCDPPAGDGNPADCDDNVASCNSDCVSLKYEDFDGDNYGNPAVSHRACDAPIGYVTDNTDCDDADENVYPGAVEICDGKDNNCDGTIPSNEADNDLDNYMICAGDCDDTDRDVYPGATEDCDDTLDNDCDGLVDCDDTDCVGDPACCIPGNDIICHTNYPELVW